MAVVTINFTSVKGENQITQLLGSPTSVAINNRGANPQNAGKLGWLSLRLLSYRGSEQFGITSWFAGRSAFTPGLNAGLYAVFQAKKAGLLMTFLYTY